MSGEAVTFISILSGLITITGFLFSLVKGLKDVNEKVLLIILVLFAIPSFTFMSYMEKTITLDFSKLLFLGSVFSHFAVAFWIPRICIDSLKSTSKNKELNPFLAAILYVFLLLISFIGFSAVSYFVYKLIN